MNTPQPRGSSASHKPDNSTDVCCTIHQDGIEELVRPNRALIFSG